jgi:uncharacterized pyridoxamine 5'-phosphate oxidase family protein
MRKLKDEVVHFFQSQGCVIVSTLSGSGHIHNSCKGIIKINYNGKIYLLDLYQGVTYRNLKRAPAISITAVDEHRFRGYCLQGKATIVNADELPPAVHTMWEDKIAGRLTGRIIKNVQGQKGHSSHPEALLPQPEYLIVMEVENCVDLTPRHLKEEG